MLIFPRQRYSKSSFGVIRGEHGALLLRNLQLTGVTIAPASSTRKTPRTEICLQGEREGVGFFFTCRTEVAYVRIHVSLESSMQQLTRLTYLYSEEGWMIVIKWLY
jgi:hypothetical protein